MLDQIEERSGLPVRSGSRKRRARVIVRLLIGTLLLTTLAVAAYIFLILPDAAMPHLLKGRKAETLVQALHASLTEPQRAAVCFPFDHPLRSKVDNNWAIVKPTIGQFFTSDQQAMIVEIFRGLHNEEYVDKV